MSRYALVIAMSRVSSGYYEGWEGRSLTSAQDGIDMAAFLSSRGYAVQSVTDEAAARDNVTTKLGDIAKSLMTGDKFVLYFSGHGAQLPNLNHDAPDGEADQVWCLSDGMLVDDEIDRILVGIPKGVEVVCISDCCHGGGIPGLFAAMLPKLAAGARKAAPRGVIERVYKTQQGFYDKILTLAAADMSAAPADILMLGACDPARDAFENAVRSRYTDALLNVLGSAGSRTYQELNDEAAKQMTDQVPVIRQVGVGSIDMKKQVAFG